MMRTSIEQLKREALAPRFKIVVSPTHSPLPYRSQDWCAYFDGEEEAGGYGYGATREEAIADFMTEAVCSGRVSPAESIRLIDATLASIKANTGADGTKRTHRVMAEDIDGVVREWFVTEDLMHAEEECLDLRREGRLAWVESK